MDARQTFKAAFINRCIEHGITDPRAMTALVKQALALAGEKQAAGFGFGIGGVADAAKGVAETGMNWGIPLALAGPPVVGGILGTLAATAANKVDDTDIQEMKDQEIMDEYRRQAAGLRRAGLVRRHEADSAAGRKGRVFL